MRFHKKDFFEFFRKYLWLFVLILAPIAYGILEKNKERRELHKMIDERNVAEKFLVSSVIDINESRIQYRKEVDVKNEFVISFFRVDSLYDFLAIKLKNNSLGIFPYNPEKETRQETPNIVMLENKAPDYYITIGLSSFPIKKDIRYFISPLVDEDSSVQERTDQYSFKTLHFSLRDNEGKDYLGFSQLSSTLRMTIDLKTYRDSKGNLYAFILYQDEDKDFLSIKDILEKK